jgi:hypothetical protein
MSQKRIAWSSQFCAKDFSEMCRHSPPYAVTQHRVAGPQSALVARLASILVARLACIKGDADRFDLC